MSDILGRLVKRHDDKEDSGVGTSIFSSPDEETQGPGDPDVGTSERGDVVPGGGSHALGGTSGAGPGPDGVRDGDTDVVRHEEQLSVGTETYESGRVRVRKEVETEPYQEVVSRGVEHAETERTDVLPGDSGQVETLPDGTVSIPVFEEQIVVEKRLVVRERILVRKHTVSEEHVVEAELRKERVEVETEGDVGVDGRTRAPGTA